MEHIFRQMVLLLLAVFPNFRVHPGLPDSPSLSSDARAAGNPLRGALVLSRPRSGVGQFGCRRFLFSVGPAIPADTCARAVFGDELSLRGADRRADLLRVALSERGISVSLPGSARAARRGQLFDLFRSHLDLAHF